MSEVQRLARQLFSVDTRSLALLRVGVAVVILLDVFLVRLPDVVPFYSDQGMLPVAISAGPKAAPGHWSIYEWSGSPAYARVLLYGTAIAAGALLVGCLTRVTTVVLWVLLVSLANRNLLVCNYGDTLLQLLLFWSIWIPWERTWSWDAWRRASRTPPEPAKQEIASVATACAMLQLALLYFFAGLWKVNEDWLSGAAVEHALALEYAVRPASRWLGDYPRLLQWATHATLLLELLGPLVVWLPWQTARIRGAMVVSFIALHVGIETFFTPLYLSHICIVAWSLFVPATFWMLPGVRVLTTSWDALLARRASARPPARRRTAPRQGRREATSWIGAARTLRSVALASLLAYIVLWNIATFDPPRLGFLLPERARWLGHVTLVRQTWDMFWVPSRYNGWFEARAELADGRNVDLLGQGRAIPLPVPTPNWWAMPNPRWKVFFRRLTESPDEEVCQVVADYLWRIWNQTAPASAHARQLDLVLVRRGDATRFGQGAVTEVRVAGVADPAADPWDDLIRRLGGARPDWQYHGDSTGR